MNGTVPARRRLLVSLGWSLTFAAAFLLLYAVAVATPLGQAVDERSYGQPYWARGVFEVLRLGCPVLAGAAAIVVVVMALARRRWLDVVGCVLGAGIVILAAGPLRDDLLVRPWLGVGSIGNSFPSRHVVVTCALALIVVRLWRARRGADAVVAFALVLTSLDALASVATFAHRASDTMGAVLLVGIVVPVYALGRVPTFGVLRRATASWRAILVVAALWLAALTLAALATGAAATVGFVVLIVLGTAGLCLSLVRALADDPVRAARSVRAS